MRRTAPEKAYEVIHAAIRDGKFGPGEFLREEQLVQLVGVSRTPIREALRRLAAEGLVKGIPNRGVQVISWAPDDIHLIFDIRLRLEGYAAGLAAAVIDDESLARLSDVSEKMDQLLPKWHLAIDEITRLNATFHQGIADACGTDILAGNIARTVQAALVVHTYRSFSNSDMERSMHHHHELLDALRSHDSDWAESVMRSHLLAARAVLLSSERRPALEA